MSTENKQGGSKGKNQPSEAQSKAGSGSTESLLGPDFTKNMTEDMQTFAKFGEVITGSAFELETREQQRKFLVEYNQWVTNGKPRPTLGGKDAEQPIPMKLYRTKSLGVQYIYWKDTRGYFHDMEIDSVTNKRKYLVPFKKDQAQALFDDAEKRCHDPTHYFKASDGSNFAVKPEDFVNADFDDLIKKIKARQYVP